MRFAVWARPELPRFSFNESTARAGPNLAVTPSLLERPSPDRAFLAQFLPEGDALRDRTSGEKILHKMQLGDDARAIAKQRTMKIYRMLRGETAQAAPGFGRALVWGSPRSARFSQATARSRLLRHRANPREPDQQHQEACLGFGDDVTKLRHVPWFWLLSD
jgi:hypothetical protein